ncbi:uncharacterized protein L201_001800 [Kwoniella dendrophila CBS 6074]|uniref:Major facilitator superfamily (MFS) profile domain-containing protein n=1 Tax=Kwoniella dendrophila CBS 6074 TaxID=1295534 RepID=A0AAX4JND9_9TREE
MFGSKIDDRPEVTHVEDGVGGEKNQGIHHVENGDIGDNVVKVANEERIEVTEEENKRIRRKTDKRILTVLIWVYFLQILDKSVLGYGNTFGMSKDTHLVGNQYSTLGSINAILQLAWQPFSSYLLVRVPARILMPVMIFGWGAAQACMAAATNFSGLMACRAFLGLFEAGCLPLFSIMTAQWYRRSEQPIRVAAWYSTNGIATIIAALMSYGLGHIDSDIIAGWQVIFMVCGLITVISAPIVYYSIDSDVQSARFFTDEEKLKCVERLRANQTGIGATEFKWSHAYELALDIKSWMYLAMTLLLNVGAAVTTYFGPALLAQFSSDKYTITLLNMPFGFLQFVAIFTGCLAASRFKIKSAIIAVYVIPVIVGLVLLYVEGTATTFKKAPAMVGYYLLSFLFGGNPITVSWMVANTAGQTKKALIMSIFNAGSAAGNIIGPYLFKDADKPHYIPGIKAVLGIFCALLFVIGLQVVVLFFLNKQRQNQRVAAGKPRYIKDTSMSSTYQAYGTDDPEGVLGQNALLDLTDFKNDEFVYLY